MKKPKSNAKPRNTLAKEIRKAVRGGSNLTFKHAFLDADAVVLARARNPPQPPDAGFFHRRNIVSDKDEHGENYFGTNGTYSAMSPRKCRASTRAWMNGICPTRNCWSSNGCCKVSCLRV